MAQAPSSKKVANSLVAVSAAAVMAVYAAGYTRTRSAADQLDAQTAERRPALPEGRGQDDRQRSHAAAEAVPGNTARDSARDETSAPAQVASLEHSQQISPATAVPGPATSSSPSSATVSTKTFEPPAPSTAEHKQDITVAAPVSPSAPAEAAPLSAPVAIASSLPPAASVMPPGPAPAPAPVEAAAPKWKDGTYTGWGSCRHGDIQAQVVIEGGRIQVATIAQCLTRYSCSVIGRLPPEVAQRQSAEVDYVSGATQSANAFYYAVLDALAKAK